MLGHAKAMRSSWRICARRWQCTSSMTFPEKTTIQLTAEETKLLDLIQYIGYKYTPQATLRVAGGWVRDKLLQIPSQDIDIALDAVTGETFAQVHI